MCFNILYHRIKVNLVTIHQVVLNDIFHYVKAVRIYTMMRGKEMLIYFFTDIVKSPVSTINEKNRGTVFLIVYVRTLRKTCYQRIT
ncbi:hypothetical protein ES703_94737 [subsurface metagenome]